MRMLMPSHAKNVQPYKDPDPIFTRYEVERQLNAMFSPQVTLPSGGYIIINQTEALVAIDVNSGKSTREFSIEDTALKTNLEASEEIARQLRLRDLAGLIVADFIDMEEKRNNRAVERKLKECLRSDRARIQVGRISHFGLLEMSRQRIRTGMVEGSTTQCAHCQGTGFVRSTESVALSVLRSLEDWLRTNPPCDLNAVTSTEAALYILNQKRSYLLDIESRHGATLGVTASERMHGANFYIEKVAPAVTATGAASAAVTQADRIIVPFESDPGEAGADQGRGARRQRGRRPGRDD
jgi:ribonuclease E